MARKISLPVMLQIICEKSAYVASSTATSMLHKDHSHAPFAPSASSEVTFFGRTNLGVKSEERHRSQKGRAKAGKDHLANPSSPQKPQNPGRPKSRDAISIHHLLNGPEGDDFVGRFPIRDNAEALVGEEDDAAIAEAEDSSEASHWSEDYERNDIFVGADMADFGVAFDTFLGGFETMTFGSFPLPHDMSQITSCGGVASGTALALEPRAYEVRQLLMATASRLALDYPEDPNIAHLGAAIQLLTHTELDHCVNLYFANYHRHCPILHPPSFQPTMVPIALLLSTAGLGAMYSSEPAKVAWMKTLFDVMEAYIFNLPGIRDEMTGSFELSKAPDEDTLHYQFQIFQSAYLMVVMQFFSGNLAARRRARRQRFCQVLSLARSFGLPTAQHPSIVSIPDEISFQRWVRNETRIRTMNIMLALDSAMGIFHNCPPRINYCELDLQMPCLPEYFELSCYSEMLQRSMFPRTRMKLIDAFQRLFAPPEELKFAFQNEMLCCWDMLYLIHVLFTHCWLHLLGNPLNRVSPSSLACAPSNIFEPMKTALANWKTLWDEARGRRPISQVREIGFETSADSYWTLTRLVVQKFEMSVENGATNSSPMTTSTFGLDFMPLEADCDNQGAHLRKILRK
ncbi:hypothetical protein ABEF93_006304 [Exophiala dermatitidis]